MLCELCWRMLRGQAGRLWRGTYDLHFQHHASLASLGASARLDCGICRVLRDDLPQHLRQHLDSAGSGGEVPWISITASLSIHAPGMYRLDFTLEGDELRRKKTFVLKEAGRAFVPFFLSLFFFLKK